MPIYEFVCDRCGRFELRRSVTSAGAPARCPSCEAEAHRLYSAPGLTTTPASLRRRIERGPEPKVVTRPQSEPDTTTGRKERRYQSPGRPWQVAHSTGSATPAGPKLQQI